MRADVANLLAEIRRSGGEVRLVGRDKLKLVAPAALLPELTERVRAAKPMLLAFNPRRRKGGPRRAANRISSSRRLRASFQRKHIGRAPA